MSRVAFVTAFFASAAVALAQTIRACMPVFHSPGGDVAPCNGQCPSPSCGVMAEPYRVGHATTQPALYFAGTNTRLVRCRRCGSAFFQDPEEV